METQFNDEITLYPTSLREIKKKKIATVSRNARKDKVIFT